MVSARSVNIEIIDELKKPSPDTFGKEHYIQSTIIIFQTVEFLLRLAKKALGRSNGVSEKVIKKRLTTRIVFLV